MTDEKSRPPGSPVSHAILDRFPQRRRELLRMAESDQYFRQLCLNHEAAVEASVALTFQPTAAHHFRCIAIEIEDEIGQMLDELQR